MRKAYSPTTLPETLEILNREAGHIRPLAGGTDLVVRLKEGRYPDDDLLVLEKVQELKFIRETATQIIIGPLTTHAEIIESPLIHTHIPLLAQGSATVGAVQIKNRGTLGGNIGTASPAGDTLPPLFALEAVIVTASVNGERKIPVDEFFTGPGKTALAANELVVAVEIPKCPANRKGIYLKLGQRKALAISVADMALLATRRDDGIYDNVRIAFGSVAPTVVRARQTEKILSGKKWTADFAIPVAQNAWKEVVPITDIRSSDAYRRDMAVALLKQGLYELMGM